MWTGVILDETRTREAIIDSLSQGFVLYDAQDRLVMRNSHYVTLYPALRGVAVPGATYEEVVKFETACVRDLPDTDLRAQFSERLEQHDKPQNVFERKLDDTRWILVSEQRTRDGGTVVLYTDITILKHREKQIQHLSLHDALTGLPNRAMFNQRVEQALARAGKRGMTVAVMCLDVDHFKNVNDSLGHVAGDALLKCISERARECLREEDTVARLGGDEFGIVLQATDAFEYATQVAGRLLTALARPMDFNGHQVVSGISVGIATSSGDNDVADQLVKNADLALYRAKTDGRGVPLLRSRDGRARAGAQRARSGPAPGAGQEPVRAALPAAGRHRGRTRFSGSKRWYAGSIDLGLVARRNSSARRGDRRHHGPRRVGAPPSLPGRQAVAGVGEGLGQRVAGAVPQSRPGATRSEGSGETALSPDRLGSKSPSRCCCATWTRISPPAGAQGAGHPVAMDDFGTGYSSLGNPRSFPFDKLSRSTARSSATWRATRTRSPS